MSKKNTLQQIIDYVNTNHPGGVVLSTEYSNCNTPMSFRCENGHIFSAKSIGVYNCGYWCKKCATQRMVDARSYSIEKIENILEKEHPGSILLSRIYKNQREKLELRCERGHDFSIRMGDIVQNVWCPKCAGVKPLTLKDIEKYLSLNHPGSRLLSQSYANNRGKLTVVCEKDHTFNPIAKTLLKGHWCPVCAPEKNRKTCLERYGVEHPAQNKDIALKQAKAINNSVIKYHWKTGEELVCVGSYESRAVDYLNFHKKDFLWQPEVFNLPVKGTYRPDLFLVEENKWIEIKGWMRSDAQLKWDWFLTKFPNAELWDQKKLKEMGIL